MQAIASVQDDAPSLREALALLGDWESDLPALLALTTPPATPQSAGPSHSPHQTLGKRPRQSNAPTQYRLRRNAHNAKLLQLQTEAESLQRLLDQERARIEAAKDPAASALARECEEMAGRQKRHRVAAENENEALRAVFAIQLELTRRMRKVADRASSLRELIDIYGHHRAALAAFDGPTIAIPQHLRYLDCRMDETSEILSTGLFQANGNRDFQQVNFRDLGFEGLQVEFALSWVVPFSTAAVEQALWAHMTGKNHKARHTDHELVHSTSELLCTRFVSEPQDHEQPNCNHGQPIAGTTHGQAAVRRYSPSEHGVRTVLAHVRARIFHEDGTHKGDMHGDGWFQVEPLPSKATATTPHVSRVKWCRRVTGRPVGHDSTTSTERAKWVHSVVSGPMRAYWENNLSLNMAAIENALITY